MPDVFANNRSILHSGDGLTQTAGPPDVCKTPSPAGPVPIPYPNIAMDSDLASGTKKVKIDGNPVATEASNLSTSSGDEPGTAGGGIVSSKFKGKLTWGSSSSDVIAEGNGVVRFMEVNQFNGNVWNTILTAMGSVTTPGYGDDPIDDPNCAICGEAKGKHRVESDDAVLKLAQDLANDLRNGAFTKVVKEADAAAAAANKKYRAKKGFMIGVLVCQCTTQKKYAGISGGRQDPAWAPAKAAFEAAAGRLGLTPVSVPPVPPPLSGNTPPTPPPFGSLSAGSWADTVARVATAQGGAGGNPPLICAAPKMIQKCLGDGHKPGKMIEIWLGISTGSQVKIPKFVHVTYDFAAPGFMSPAVSTQEVQNQTFSDGDSVPSCTTCQVVATVMLCKLGQPPCP